MKHILPLLLFISALHAGCQENVYQDLSISDDFRLIGAYAAENRNNLPNTYIISSSGQKEKIQLYTYTNTSKTFSNCKNKKCIHYNAEYRRLILRATELPINFEFGIHALSNGDRAVFGQSQQDFGLRSSYELDIQTNQTNRSSVSENGNTISQDHNIDVEVIGAYSTQDKDYEQVYRFTNVGASEATSPVAISTIWIDFWHGIVQFQTNDGELWDVVY